MLPFVEQLDREVSATPQEFARGLAVAFPGQMAGGPANFRITAPEAAMDIELTPLPPRRIASLELPTLRVRIRFVGGNTAQRRALVEHLDRATQRGGG